MTKDGSVKPRRRYSVKEDLPRISIGNNRPFEFIAECELLAKINSDNYKIHPLFPILVNRNGTEMYDIRDGFKVIIRTDKGRGSRKICRIKSYKGGFSVYHIVVEAWNSRLIAEHVNGQFNVDLI